MHTYVSFLAYDLEEQKNLTDCTDGKFLEQKGPHYDACRFPLNLLEACSGEIDPQFGYSRGNPCILVKMNRVCTYFTAAATFFLSPLLRSWQLCIKCYLIWW